MVFDEKIYQIAFSLVNGIGPQSYRLIMEEFEQVSDVYQMSDSQLKEIITRDSIRKEILEKAHFDKAEREYKNCQKNDIQILYYKDKAYPQRLNFHNGTPCIIYYRGTADLNTNRIVSIVGTRDPSEYGKVVCEKIVKELAKHQCLIVSGLAFGVDITAHKAALSNNLNTIGVMASGLSTIYPKAHESTAKKMITQGGLLTEFLHDAEMLREMFPMRNRIVAAISDATIVVQSATKGGSLITAEFANEYGKDVFAVPGRPNDEHSKGCNLLIKSHKAHMYESLKDLEYILRWSAKKKVVQASLFQDLSDEENQIIQFVRNSNEAHEDDIHKHLNKPAGSLAAIILTLELNGLLKSIPGTRYICT